MTFNEAKNMLERYELDVMKLNGLKEQIEVMRERLESVGYVITGMPRGTRDNDIFASTFANIERNQEHIIRLTRKLSYIDATISKVPEPYHTVLIGIYCKNETVEQIAEYMEKSERTVWRWRNKGINIFSECQSMSLNVSIDM